MNRILTMIPICFLAGCLWGQTPTGYVDVYVVKVKPEKRADFDAIGKKVADANRRHKGDNWLAYSIEYGEQNTVIFSSLRDNYASIDKATETFMGAMKESYGPAFMKVFQDMNNCTQSSRGELRRRRQDLSWNIPPDPAALSKYIGESKWLRLLTARVRPGHGADYEDNVKAVKTAFEKASVRRPVLVSQAVVGMPATTYYFSSFYKSLTDMDAAQGAQTLQELMGASVYGAYQKSVADHTLGSEWSIARIVPELSNPPEEIASAMPGFWRPKPAAAPKPKPKAEAAKPGQ
jgi:hypothetical protein